MFRPFICASVVSLAAAAPTFAKVAEKPSYLPLLEPRPRAGLQLPSNEDAAANCYAAAKTWQRIHDKTPAADENRIKISTDDQGCTVTYSFNQNDPRVQSTVDIMLISTVYGIHNYNHSFNLDKRDRKAVSELIYENRKPHLFRVSFPSFWSVVRPD